MQVLSKFQSGNHNVLVSTCIGEEGLDIGQVDLIICYDSQNSPIRMLQRSGRTGRKREGRIVLLLSEGKEEDAHEKSMASYKHVQKGIQDGRKLTMFPPNRMLPVGVRPKREFIKVDVVDVPPAKKERKSKASSTTTTAKTSKAAGIVYTANEKSLMNRLSTIYPLDRSIKFESSNLGKYPHYNTCPLNDGVVSRSSTSLMLVEFLNESDNLKSCLTSVKIPRRPDFNHVNHKNGLFYLDQVNIIDSDSDVSIVHASKRPKTNVIEDDDDSLSESDLPNFSVMKKKEVIVIESDDDEQPIEIELMHNLYAFDKLAEDLEFQVEDGHDFQDYEYETPLIEEYIAESIITTASSSRIYSFNELFRQDQDPVDAEIKVYLGTSPNDFLKGIESLCNNGNIIIELKQFPIYSSSFNSIIGAESFNDLVDKDISMDEKVDQLNVKYVSIDEKVEELIDNDISMDELIDNDISKDEKLDELIETDFKQNQIKREQSFDIHSDDEFDWNAVELPVEKLETKLLESKPECVQDQFADCDDDFFDAFQLEVGNFDGILILI